MKTFVEDFEYFKKELSYEKLFLEGMISEHRKKKEDRIIIYFTLLVKIVFLILLFNMQKYLLWFILIAVVVFMIYCLFNTNRKRKFLKNKKGISIPKMFNKWKSKELEVLRLKKIHKEYDKIDSSIITKLIEIATNKLKNNFEDPFIVFEKTAGYFGATLSGFLIGFFADKFKDDLGKNFEFFLKFFIGLFLFQIFIVVSYHFIKRGYLFDKQSEKDYLQDYVFVMENILLMKESKNCND